VKNKLEYMYALQLIDTDLDTLQEQKGDLPFEVEALENDLAAMRARHDAAEQAMRKAFSDRDTADSDIVGLREKLDKYKGQQFAVKSNREYDALSREMDAATESVARLEKEMTAFEIKATTSRTEMEELKVKVEVIEKQLAEKQAALDEVSKLTEEEELQHKHERENAVARITKADLAAYERIRKAKKGMAVVPILKGACGGCYNRLPPQKLLELRTVDKMFTCERCGRIIVSDEIAENVKLAKKAK